jgi:Bifunctional DNA primase/polymerase, N-terminal
VTNSHSILEAALAYAERGWEVFPVPPGTKKSYLSSKFNGNDKWGKTTDPALIRQYWLKWPHANVAIVTGMKSGIWVMEADTAAGHGVDGIASLRALEKQHGRLPTCDQLRNLLDKGDRVWSLAVLLTLSELKQLGGHRTQYSLWRLRFSE